MATRIQLRGDTAANWTAANPILAEREFALETDTRKYKIGDGVTYWTGLTYSAIDVSAGTNIDVTSGIVSLQENIDVTSLSADTLYSGTTSLQSIFDTVNNRLGEGLSTGIISGGTLSINAGDNTKFDIAAGLGYIVDYSVYPQSTQLLSWATQTGLTVTNLATAFATDVAINLSGTVLQQGSFTREELRSVIFLGGLDHSNQTNIRNVFQINVPTYGVGSSLKDLTLAIGDINIDGNVFSSNGANLKIDKSAGSTFSFGRNYQSNQNDPNVLSQSATTQQVFRYAFNNGSGIATFLPESTDIDPNTYDAGGGATGATPNNKYTIQRILMFANTQNTFIQYGETVYNTKDEAIANLASASFTNLVGLRTALVRGYLIVKQGVTDLSGTDTVFVNGDKFGGIGGGSGVAATDYYTTGATLSGTSIVFDRNDTASAYSVNLSTLIPSRYDYDLVVAASDETTAITTGTSKVTFHAPSNFTLTGVTASLTTTGSTSSVIDLNYNGSTVFASPITLASGVYYNTSATTTTAISQYGKFTVDVDTAGTGAAGLKVALLGYKSF